MHVQHGCWQVYCSGGQREIRGRELHGLFAEQRELSLDSPACRQKGKECQFNQQTANWPAGKLAIQKVLPFCGPGYISPLSIYSFHLYGRGIVTI
jgi:hypothetical protein